MSILLIFFGVLIIVLQVQCVSNCFRCSCGIDLCVLCCLCKYSALTWHFLHCSSSVLVMPCLKVKVLHCFLQNLGMEKKKTQWQVPTFFLRYVLPRRACTHLEASEFSFLSSLLKYFSYQMCGLVLFYAGRSDLKFRELGIYHLSSTGLMQWEWDGECCSCHCFFCLFSPFCMY